MLQKEIDQLEAKYKLLQFLLDIGVKVDRHRINVAHVELLSFIASKAI